jgi:hypothetical protein
MRRYAVEKIIEVTALRKKFDFNLVFMLLLATLVLFSGGCGGGGGDDGDDGDKTFSDLPILPPAPVTSGNWNDVADTSWYSEAQSAFTISTAEQLAGMAHLDLQGKTVTLADDIDLAGKEWSPVSSLGSFDGNGHTISNMTITGDVVLAGLFEQLTTGETVKNLNLTNVYIVSALPCNAGGIATLNSGAIENCTVSGVISTYVQRGFSNSGGIAGENNSSGKVDNCTFSGSVFASSAESANPYLLDAFPYAGGAVGYNGGEVLNSSSNGKVSSYPYHGVAGGIAGRNAGTVAGCKSGSDVSCYARGPDAGGVVGLNYDCGEVIDSSSSSSVSSYNSNNTWFASAGGIVARNYGSVKDCLKTSGKITITNTKSPYAFAGGIIGASEAETISGNTFSRAGTGQQWGTGLDSRVNGPSNDGATPID